MRHLFKTYLLIICAALAASAVYAQDKIYKKDGTVIAAKVISVGEKKIAYKRPDNPGGPLYSILVLDVTGIVYQNGTKDFFDNFDNLADKKEQHNNAKDTSMHDSAGKNIFTITPVAYTAALDGTINDPGIGIGYERLLGRTGRISINMPVIISFSSAKDYANNTVFINGANLTYGSYTSVYFMPGIKFYPAPDKVKVRYSLGVSFFCIFGGEPQAAYEANSPSVNYITNGTYVYPTGTYHYAMYGLMLSNSVNIATTKHLYMAIDIGAGLPVSDNRYAAPVESLGIPLPFVQMGYKIGYRY